MKRLDTLDELRPFLQLPAINTGRTVTPLGPSGPVMTDMEQLTALTDEKGFIIFKSGLELTSFAYRGQTEDWPCIPALARKDKLEDRFLASCQNIAFQDILSEHPYIALTRSSTFLDTPIYVDLCGLAQHYGLHTDMLDLSLNFEVASFFATCRWDDASRCFQPICTAKRPGIIYRMMFPLWNGGFPAPACNIIGWQPLPRPAQQRAVGIRLRTLDDLDKWPGVQIIKFRQSKDVSSRIFELFNKGKDLFPNDVAADMAEEAKALKQFTASQIQRAWENLENFDPLTPTAAEMRQAIESVAKMDVCDAPKLSWKRFEIERDENKLLDRLRENLSRVRYRLTAYL